MASEFGTKIKTSVFGASHGNSIGVCIDGIPAGEKIDIDELISFLSRRRPGKGPLATSRRESDTPEFISGIEDGITTGFPICAVIKNSDMHSQDYSNLKKTPRPAHADYTAFVKYHGHADMRGGGHFSGRLTAPLCIAGGIAKQILARHGIYIGAHIFSIGSICDDAFPLYPDNDLFNLIASSAFPAISSDKGALMAAEISKASGNLDSVGGVVECAVCGLPAGLGNPMFDGIENRLASVVFGIPGVKGIEFGSGFSGSQRTGSQNNDPFIIDGNGNICTETNNHGGILGGITTGMPVIFRTALKPTPSIAQKQRTVDLETLTPCEIEIKGRHDPCIALRAVPVVEAVAASVILDILLEEN